MNHSDNKRNPSEKKDNLKAVVFAAAVCLFFIMVGLLIAGLQNVAADTLYVDGCKLVKGERGYSIVDYDEFMCGKEKLTIPEQVRGVPVVSISARAFESSNIKEIVLPASLLEIEDEAFYWCYTLESIEFAENSKLASIGSSAFDRCGSLTSIDSLKTINFQGTKAQWKEVNKGEDWNYFAGGYRGYTVVCTDGTLNEEGAQ